MPEKEEIDLVLERFYQRYNRYNSEVLKKLGEVIVAFEGLSAIEAKKKANELRYSKEVQDMINDLIYLNVRSINDVDILFDKLGKDNLEEARKFYEAKGLKFTEYENNKSIKKQVEAIKQETLGTFENISNSKNVGFVLEDDKGNKVFKPLQKTYNDLVDEAVVNVTTGKEDWQSGMRKTIRGLADSGVKVHEESVTYKSGYNKRIDNSVKQNILTGMRQINIGIQRQVGEEFGADGVEISAHSMCAPDHEPIQGLQYSNEEFEELNNDLVRPIGELNCTHFVFSIVLGVSQPSYTRSMLDSFIEESEEEFEYEGKTYTRYEATQVQRKLETAIRRQKDRQIIGRASNYKKLVKKSQNNISKLTSKYSDFSNKAGLKTYKENLTVSGYHKVKVG